MREIDRRYQDKLQRIPPSGGGGCHQALLGVANLAVMSGVALSQFIADVRPNLSGGRNVSDREITDAYSRAFKDKSEQGDVQIRIPEQNVVRPTQSALDLMIGNHCHSSLMDIIEKSPIRLLNDAKSDIFTLFECLYRDDDILFIGHRTSTAVKTVAEWRNDSYLPAYEFIVPNPMTGEEALTSMNTPSRRCDATVKGLPVRGRGVRRHIHGEAG